MVRTLGFGLLVLTIGVAGAADPEPALTGINKHLLTRGSYPRLVEVEDVSAILAHLSKHHDIRITLDAPAFERAGVRNPAKAFIGNRIHVVGTLYRILRMIAVVLHPTGALEVRGDRIILTTVKELEKGGHKPLQFPRSKDIRDRVLAAEKKLDTVFDLDLSCVDAKDMRVGTMLGVVALITKVDIELRQEVFARFGVDASAERAPFRAGPYRGKLRDFIKDCLLNVKPEGDELLVLVGDDGTLVITTKKYKDDPIPPDAVKPAD